MAVSKVAYDGHTLIDLTGDTAVEADVASGKTFHKADGTQAVGTAAGGGGTVNLQNKTVNLGSSAPPSVSADDGYDGLGQVSFNVSGISATNIKNGESICGVNGTYNPAANFTRHITLTFSTVDGTTPADILVTYRGADTVTPQNVVWKSLAPDQVETEPGYFDYECEFDLVTGSVTSQADGAYIAVGGGCSLDASQTPEILKFIERSNSTDLFYVIFPTSTNTFDLTLAVGSYTPPVPYFGRSFTLTYKFSGSVDNDRTQKLYYRGYDTNTTNAVVWKSINLSADGTQHTVSITLCPMLSSNPNDNENAVVDGFFIEGTDGSATSDITVLAGDARCAFVEMSSGGQTGSEHFYIITRGSSASIEIDLPN